MVRFVLKFNKGEEVRWLGHLDLLRAFERILRRAEVPVTYSQGFNPRAKMSFASALGVGVTGDEEILMLQMDEDLQPDHLKDRLNEQMPAGIHINEVTRVPDGGPKSVQVSGSEMLVSVRREAGFTEGELKDAVERFMARDEINVFRDKGKRPKMVNLRPSVESIIVDGSSHLLMRLTHGEGFTPKPSEIVEVLAEYLPGIEVEKVHRVKMY